MTTVLLYAATVLVWGFSWYAIELQVGTVAPEVSVAYRFGLASLLQFAWCWVAGIKLRMSLADHLNCAMLGAMIFGVNLLLVYYATAELPSGLVSVVFSFITVINIFNARLFLGRTTKPIVWFAAGLGVIGIVLIFNEDVTAASIGAGVLTGALFAFAGAYVASAGNVFAIKVQERGLSVLQSNAWGMGYGALIVASFAVINGASFTFLWTPEYIGGLAYLVIFGSIAGFGFYISLIRRIGPERAGYTAVMFPAVALMVSAWLEDLAVTPLMALGAALILFGNVLVLTPPTALKRLFGKA
jgi:drug/metabolite transporter (DMT)-like permease